MKFNSSMPWPGNPAGISIELLIPSDIPGFNFKVFHNELHYPDVCSWDISMGDFAVETKSIRLLH